MSVRLDLHVHSRHSPDSSVPVERYVAGLRSVSLHGLALTDHNTVRGHAELREAAARVPGTLVLPGVEVSTLEGHLLAYGVDAAPPPARPLVETIEWVDRAGGVAVPAHPFRWTHGIGRRAAELAPVAALEGMNAHNSEGTNRRAQRLAADRRLGTTGGSDAHRRVDLGRAFTEFPDGVASVADLLEAIRRGHTRGSGTSAGLPARAGITFRSTLLRLRRRFRPI